MPTQSLLYSREIEINDYIKIVIPTVGDILKDEDSYYSVVASLTSTPADLMVPLDDIGIDFSEISEYEAFLMTFESLKTQDTSLVLGDLDVTKFRKAINKKNNMLVLYDEENDLVIDNAIQWRISKTLRDLHHIESDRRQPANKAARDYMVERARIKLNRRKREKTTSYLETEIVALVNTEQFKYNYETVKGLTIYQFNESVKQIVHKIDYDNRMRGVFAGTISAKDLNQKDMTWFRFNEK